MSTYAEDVRMVLAEVEPKLAWLITEPVSGEPWARIGIVGNITREQYLVIRRAGLIARRGRGTKEPIRTCNDCAWAAFSTRDNEAKARHAREGCGHSEAAS